MATIRVPMQEATKENVDPNARQSPLQAASKAQMISARLAEWKKRMGVEAQPQHSVLTAATAAPSQPPALCSPEVSEKHEASTSREEAPRQEEADSSSALVFDFSEPAAKSHSRGTRGFVPGSHTQRLLAARAQKKAEEASALTTNTAAPPAAEIPTTPQPRPVEPLLPAEQPSATAVLLGEEVPSVCPPVSPPHLISPSPSHSTTTTTVGTCLEHAPEAHIDDTTDHYGDDDDDHHGNPSVLGDLADEEAGFDLELSLCESSAPKSPQRLLQPQRNQDQLLNTGETPVSEWEARYHEEHAKLESVQALLHEYERDLELVLLRQHEQHECTQQLRLQLEAELCELKAEFVGVTDSFTDVKRRYDEAKNLNESLRKSESTLVEALHKSEEARTEAEARFEALRVHAEEKLASAASELLKAVTAHRQAESAQQTLAAALAEQTKLASFWKARALVAEAKLPGLAQELALKEQENRELLTICDQLVASLQPGADDAGAGVTVDEAPDHQEHHHHHHPADGVQKPSSACPEGND